jgi:hypothetical protein
LRFDFLGRIAHDNMVEEYVLAGKSLLDLPFDSPTYLSVKMIMEKAGYIKK